MEEPPNTLRDLYFEFGRAVEMAQVMEVEAGNLALSFAALEIDKAKVTKDQRRQFQALVADVNKRTFGNLMRQIRKAAKVDENIEKIVNEALERRNHLIHHFFRYHNFAIHSEEGRAVMRAEIGTIQESLVLAHTVLSGMTKTLDEIFGVASMAENQAQALVEKGRKIEI